MFGDGACVGVGMAVGEVLFKTSTLTTVRKYGFVTIRDRKRSLPPSPLLKPVSMTAVTSSRDSVVVLDWTYTICPTETSSLKNPAAVVLDSAS